MPVPSPLVLLGVAVSRLPAFCNGGCHALDHLAMREVLQVPATGELAGGVPRLALLDAAGARIRRRSSAIGKYRLTDLL